MEVYKIDFPLAVKTTIRRVIKDIHDTAVQSIHDSNDRETTKTQEAQYKYSHHIV